jgi:hypothetical protein
MKYFAVLACMAGVALVSQSCAPDGPPTAPSVKPRVVQQNLDNLHAKYDWLGKYHTDGLAYVYTQLAKGKGKPRTPEEICRVIAKATKEFHRSVRHADVPAALVDPALNNETCPSGSDGPSKTLLTTGFSGVRKADLSAVAQSLVSQIVYAPQTATSRYQLTNMIYDLEAQATTLPEDEAGVVIGVGSVVLSSMDYWESNLAAWVTIPMATAYSINASDTNIFGIAMTGTTGSGWWNNTYIKGFRKVLIADGVAAVRSIYMGWELGPIAWEAAAASAVWGSGTTAISLLF